MYGMKRNSNQELLGQSKGQNTLLYHRHPFLPKHKGKAKKKKPWVQHNSVFQLSLSVLGITGGLPQFSSGSSESSESLLSASPLFTAASTGMASGFGAGAGLAFTRSPPESKPALLEIYKQIVV